MLTFRLAQFHPIVRPFVDDDADIKRQRTAGWAERDGRRAGRAINAMWRREIP